MARVDMVSTGRRPRTGSPPVDALLRSAGRRLALFRMAIGALHGLFATTVLAWTVIVLHRLFSPEWSPFPAVGVLIVLGGIAGGVVAMVFRRRTNLDAALAIERRVDLRERLSSVLFLKRLRVPGELRDALLRDGEAHARKVNVKRAIPWERPRVLIPWVIALSVVLATHAFLPDLDLLGVRADREGAKRQKELARKREAERRRQVQEHTERAREAIRRLEIPETERILAKLAERTRLDQVGERETKRQSLVDLQHAKDALRERRTRGEMQKLESFLKRMRSQGRDFENPETKRVSEALRQGDLNEAAKALDSLAKRTQDALEAGQLDPAQLASLDEDLQRILGDFDLPSLGEKLAKGMQNDLSAGDLAQLMGDASQDLSALARLLKERELLDNALTEITFTQDELAALPAKWPETDGL